VDARGKRGHDAERVIRRDRNMVSSARLASVESYNESSAALPFFVGGDTEYVVPIGQLRAPGIH
jgi:hypothetical protein